jgi:hypothetical protein
MVDRGMPELKTEEKNSLDQTPIETRPKSECKKSEESMEMLKFFDCLSESTCKEVLKNLCRTGEGRYTKPKNLFFDKTCSAMENQSDMEKAHLYNDLIETQRKKALAKRYVGKIPSHQLQSGLQITLVSCKEKDLVEVKVIHCKHDCGDDAISHNKTRDKLVKSLETKITAGNLGRVLTSIDANEHDIAADAISWQSILKSICLFCTQYDMTSLIMIPQGVDLSKPQHVAKATSFKDTIKDWQDLFEKDYFKWQEFLLRHSTELKLESNNRLDNVLHLSMEKTLCSEVESNLNSIPKNQRGSITTL